MKNTKYHTVRTFKI